ncbi:MAG: cytochrome c [Bacteroidetes bacterium]|nr:cytochrome c [Bacteroidota bacterium]
MKLFKNQLKIFSCLSFLLISGGVVKAQKETMEQHKRRWDTPAWTDTIKNPLAHVAAAADSGKVTYLKICSVCHGNGGKGDGVAAAGLAIKPANHTGPNVQLQTDGSLFYELSNGHAPMPAYKTILTEKQRWQLICFIRTLKPKTKEK